MAAGSRRTARFWATWGVWLLASFTIVAVIAGIVVVAQSGSPNPTEATSPQTHAVVVVNSSIIVFREGLEAILIFAAVTASMLGAQRRLRKPVVGGAAVAFVATVATWFLAQAILAQFSAYSDELLAITGLIAVGVLLVIMNWFFHKVYWTQWIGKRNDQRKRALARSAEGGFLAARRSHSFCSASGASTRGLRGCPVLADAPAPGRHVGCVGGRRNWTSRDSCRRGDDVLLQQKLPTTDARRHRGLLGAVLVVMIGGSARTLQDLGGFRRHRWGLPTGSRAGSRSYRPWKHSACSCSQRSSCRLLSRPVREGSAPARARRDACVRPTRPHGARRQSRRRAERALA